MPLIYFVLGILFIRCFVPLVDQFLSWVLTIIEHKKMRLGVKNTKLEKRMEEIVNENSCSTRQIGFVVDDPTEYETEEEEEEEYNE